MFIRITVISTLLKCFQTACMQSQTGSNNPINFSLCMQQLRYSKRRRLGIEEAVYNKTVGSVPIVSSFDIFDKLVMYIYAYYLCYHLKS